MIEIRNGVRYVTRGQGQAIRCSGCRHLDVPKKRCKRCGAAYPRWVIDGYAAPPLRVRFAYKRGDVLQTWRMSLREYGPCKVRVVEIFRELGTYWCEVLEGHTSITGIQLAEEELEPWQPDEVSEAANEQLRLFLA